MKDIAFTPALINIELLDQQLKNALSGKCFGVSWDSATLTVHLDDSVVSADIDQVTSIVNAHDPAQLTTKLQPQVDADIAVLKAINVSDPSSAYTAIHRMAQILAVQLDTLRMKL